MRRIVIETPYAGAVDRNIAYARRCLADSLARDEAPIVSHLLHTQVLDDDDPGQRSTGIRAGHAWIPMADAVAVYEDHGISPGMRVAIDIARAHGVPVEWRTIGAIQ